MPIRYVCYVYIYRLSSTSGRERYPDWLAVTVRSVLIGRS